MKIFKYPLEFDTTEKAVIHVPSGGKILKLDKQDIHACLWIEVNPTAPLEDRHFTYVGTGWEYVPTPLQTYIGTIFDGPFVWHIFEVFNYG